MNKITMSLIAVSFVFTSGFINRESQRRLIVAELTVVDNALQDCISRTQEAQPTSMEVLRSIQLREKIFFAVSDAKSRKKSVDVDGLRATVREAEKGLGIGLVCRFEVKKALKKTRAFTKLSAG